MKKFTRSDVEAFLAETKLRSKRVPVPEFGFIYTVREMNGTERDEYESSIVKTNGTEVTIDSTNLRARLVSLCVIDPDTGERCFTEKDVLALGQKSAQGLERLVNVARSLSKLEEDEMEALGKRSKATRGAASASM